MIDGKKAKKAEGGGEVHLGRLRYVRPLVALSAVSRTTSGPPSKGTYIFIMVGSLQAKT